MAIWWTAVLAQHAAHTPYSQAAFPWMIIDGFKCWPTLWPLCLGDESRYDCYFVTFRGFMFSGEQSDMSVRLHTEIVILEASKRTSEEGGEEPRQY